ncbi:MAG: Copper Transporter integral membrane protein that functions in high affinity copper transport [Bogoriella megaspora]|nr:MAG: Copper Transporter integral membrane protein that functions in high affinity copper transport [Bogoriella megaspora]
MSSMSMSMPSMTMTSSLAPPMASSTSGSMSMGGMGGMEGMEGMEGMGAESACKISMLWNWYTIDACFLSESWRITSHSMFAGSCIGIILLVMSLEGLRRLAVVYDGYLLRKYTVRDYSKVRQKSSSERSLRNPSNADDIRALSVPIVAGEPTPQSRTVRPGPLEQAVRSWLHMMQFGVAYLVMLLAMYYNGYILLSILIGAFLGFFLFQWKAYETGSDQNGRLPEATVCCG